MKIGVLEIKLCAPWVHSLKEKRMIVKSLISKIKNKYNVSISESDYQDIHQTIGLAIACVFSDDMLIDSVWDNIINFIESNTEAEIVNVNREIR